MSDIDNTTRHSIVVDFGTEMRKSPLEKASDRVHGEDKTGRSWVDHPANLAELKRLYDPYHSRCLRLKAMCSVGLGWEKEGGGELVLPGNKSGETAQDVLNEVADDVEDVGGGCLELVLNAGGRIGELNWVPASQCRFNKDRTRIQQSAGANKTAEWPVWNGKWPAGARSCILYIAQEGTWSSYYGEPDWLGGLSSIMLATSARLYLRKLLDNNCIPPVMVTIMGHGLVDKPRTDPTTGKAMPSPLEETVKAFERNFKGAANAGKALFQSLPNADAKIQVDRLGSSLGDTKDLVQILAHSRDEIISNHGVPPRLAGVVASGSLGGAGELLGQMLLFDQTLVSDRHRIWQEALNPVIPFMEGVTGSPRIAFRGLDLEGLDGGQTGAGTPQDAIQRVERMLATAVRKRPYRG